MTWYNILLIISATILVAQIVASFIGNVAEYDADFEASDFFSFKGIVHFILGASLVLTLFDKVNFSTCLLAVSVGLAFSYLLWRLYRFVYKSLKQELKYEIEFDKKPGKIYYWDNKHNRGEATVILEGRETNIPITSKSNKRYNAGDRVAIDGSRKAATIN